MTDLFVSHHDCAKALQVTKGVFFHFLRVAGHPVELPTCKIRGDSNYPVNGRPVDDVVRYLRARTNITADQEQKLRSMARPSIDVAKRAKAA